MKRVYIFKNRSTGEVKNITAYFLESALNHLHQELGWGELEVKVEGIREAEPEMEV